MVGCAGRMAEARSTELDGRETGKGRNPHSIAVDKAHSNLGAFFVAVHYDVFGLEVAVSPLGSPEFGAKAVESRDKPGLGEVVGIFFVVFFGIFFDAREGDIESDSWGPGALNDIDPTRIAGKRHNPKFVFEKSCGGKERRTGVFDVIVNRSQIEIRTDIELKEAPLAIVVCVSEDRRAVTASKSRQIEEVAIDDDIAQRTENTGGVFERD